MMALKSIKFPIIVKKIDINIYYLYQSIANSLNDIDIVKHVCIDCQELDNNLFSNGIFITINESHYKLSIHLNILRLELCDTYHIAFCCNWNICDPSFDPTTTIRDYIMSIK